MTDEMKAQRSIVRLGDLEIEGFMLPDSSYRMSQAQAAEAIGEAPVYALRFLQSRDSKALLGEAYTDYKPESIEVESEAGKRGQTRINALPLEVVSAYWLSRVTRGNKKALVLVWALLTESLDRRFDRAFGISRTESEYNDRLIAYTRQLESSLAKLGEAYSVEDDIRRENEFFKQRFKDLGIDPYALPGEDFDPRDDE